MVTRCCWACQRSQSRSRVWWSSSPLRWQAARRPGATSFRAGWSVRQTSSAAGQRAREGTPGRQRGGSGGMPEICGSRRRRVAIDGMLAARPRRVRMERHPQQLRDRRLLRNAPGVQHDRPLAQLPDDTQVVGDEQQGHAPVTHSARSRSRIWAWTVTSSAVVGSSAMSTDGSQASAIAIITRWRMPPDSSCG